jgi:hypothetical protein
MPELHIMEIFQIAIGLGLFREVWSMRKEVSYMKGELSRMNGKDHD